MPNLRHSIVLSEISRISTAWNLPFFKVNLGPKDFLYFGFPIVFTLKQPFEEKWTFFDRRQEHNGDGWKVGGDGWKERGDRNAFIHKLEAFAKTATEA